jgi:hypothetical protein
MGDFPKIRVNPGNQVEGGDIEITVIDSSLDKENEKKHVQVVIQHQNINQNDKRYRDLNRVNTGKTPATFQGTFNTKGLSADVYVVQYRYDVSRDGDSQENHCETSFVIIANQVVKQTVEVDSKIALQKTEGEPTIDQPLWVAIRNKSNAIGFDRYKRFINTLFNIEKMDDSLISAALEKIPENSVLSEFSLNIHGPYAYSVLKMATEIFLTLESGLVKKDNYDQFSGKEEYFRLSKQKMTKDRMKEELSQYLAGGIGKTSLPYLDRIVESFFCTCPNDKIPEEVLPFSCGILQHRFTRPSMIELIWSYWHEEGMLAQTMNAIAMRFQNQSSLRNDPLAELELDPLRPLNNLIWGFVQDENNRLTVRRRALEYDHQYGFKIQGRAVPYFRSADSRSKFIESFHNLLYRTALFYREDADTTVVADAFPLLNALKDVHMILAEGAHNQYGDLPWTARAEMLTQQWMLARPEMKEFLRGRYMVPYQEPWMGAVDAMKRLMGWGDVTVSHFNELAVDGERILLSIRFGDWSDLNNIEQQARNWARYWKPEIQRYLHGYLAVTGVDLMADITDTRDAAIRYTQPSQLLQQRLLEQSRKSSPALPGFMGRTARLPEPSRGAVSRRPDFSKLSGIDYIP